MLWVKHDTAANNDAKLKKLRIKYGLEGYGLYWYCIELIAADVTKDNLTFELEHDAEIIAHDTGIHYERVQEMMTYMVGLNLFEQNGSVITCLKIAKRLDKSMTNSPKMREMIEGVRTRHDIVSTCHDRREEKRGEEKRIEKNSKQDKEPDFSSLSLSIDQVDELIRIRKKNKGGKITQRVITGLAKEFNLARNAGMNSEDILTEWETRGWKSFKAEWVMPKGFGKPDKMDSSINALQGFGIPSGNQTKGIGHG